MSHGGQVLCLAFCIAQACGGEPTSGKWGAAGSPIPHTRGTEPGEFQGHRPNQACHKSGTMPPKYHAIFSIRANRRIVLQTLFKTVLHLLMTDRVRVKELSLA
jgi:hypothetical protein